MKAHFKYESFLITILKWLETQFLRSGRLHWAERLLNKFLRILKTRGKVEAIRFCKESRHSILQWLITIGSLEKSSRSSTVCGLPRHLRFLKHLETLKHPDIRLILSSLYASRGLSLPPVPNVDSITRPASKRYPDIEEYVKDFWKDLGYHPQQMVPKAIYWKKFHLSTKNGPNGQALWSAIADLSVLPPELVESIKVIGGERLSSRIECLGKYLHVFLPFFNVIGRRFRKVSAISDLEGKTREIAILDYWSQTALSGLHKYLFRALKKIPQDCTFDQGGFKDKLKWIEDGHLFHSVDLTTATDRFPIRLISAVLKGHLNEHFVNSWQNVMVGFPFDTVQGKISYSVGNPMGAYSSWNSFAISHHYVVYYCCRKLGIKWSEAPYVMLGDDIVIKHNDLAKMYMEVMTSLDVGISLQKSHISKTMYEFAKRIFYIGEEITPFPISALYSTRRTPSLMLNVLVNEEQKGWTSPIGTPIVLSELYRMLGFNATYVAKKLKVFFTSYQVMIGIRGRKTANEVIDLISEAYYPRIVSLFKNNLMNAILFKDVFCKTMFMKMLDTSLVSSVAPRPHSKPLGMIAEQLVMMITGRDDTIIDAFDLIQAIPVLQIHGAVEETYMAVVKGGYDQTLLALKSDWKSVLRALTIPISDQVYISRNQELMIHASFTLAKILSRQLNDINDQADLIKFISTGREGQFSVRST